MRLIASSCTSSAALHESFTCAKQDLLGRLYRGLELLLCATTWLRSVIAMCSAAALLCIVVTAGNMSLPYCGRVYT